MNHFFDHERLEVYQVARALNREVRQILSELKRGSGESAENLGRAARSITRNIAEAGGKRSAAERTNFYHIASGSAHECAASLDELVDFGFVSEQRIVHAKELAWRVVSMLVRLIRSLRADGVADGRGPARETAVKHKAGNVKRKT